VHRPLIGALAAGALLITPGAGLAASPPQSIELSGTARDFRGYDLQADRGLPRGHVDFENANGGPETGIVTAQLGADGLPVYAKDGVMSANTHGGARFDEWFRDTPTVNLAEPLALTLDRQPNGSYRFDDQTFFPLDGRGWVARGDEPPRVGGHNFSFTVALRSELLYRGGETIAITGDDDIWLFLNGRLAIDLGGIHGPMSGIVDLDQQAARLGLQSGRAIDVDLFVAERHTTGSTLTLTTPRLGFDPGTAAVAAASATPTAGDTLTCSAAGWHPDLTLTYAWTRDGAPIAGADGAAYATTGADGGRSLACEVTGRRRGVATATSDAIAVAVRPEPEPDPGPDEKPPPPTPPAVTVTEAPNALTNAREIRIAFVSGPAASSYECRLDDGPWAPCASPHTFARLSGGLHRVEVRSVTADGRRGTGSVVSFEVNPYPPGVRIARGALRANRHGAVTVRLACSPREGGGHGQCRGTVVLRGTVRSGGRRRTIVLGSSSFATTAGRTATPRVRLTRAGRRLLARAGRRGIAVRVLVDAHDLAGNRARTSGARLLRGDGR
jgi:fibro-slime domain-containing protein